MRTVALKSREDIKASFDNFQEMNTVSKMTRTNTSGVIAYETVAQRIKAKIIQHRAAVKQNLNRILEGIKD